MTLSNKHQEFINWYLQLWNQTEAYKRTYPKSSDAAARANAARLIANDSVAAEIKRRIAERTMGPDEVLMRLGEQARADISDFFDVHEGLDNMFFLNLDKAKKAGKLHLIKKMKYSAAGLPELELYDAQAALVHIGKHHKLFADKLDVEHGGEITLRVLYGDGTDDSTT